MKNRRIEQLESEFRAPKRDLEYECENFLWYAPNYSTDDLFWEYSVFSELFLELDGLNEEYISLTGNSNHLDYHESRNKFEFILRAIRDELEERGEDITSLL